MRPDFGYPFRWFEGDNGIQEGFYGFFDHGKVRHCGGVESRGVQAVPLQCTPPHYCCIITPPPRNPELARSYPPARTPPPAASSDASSLSLVITDGRHALPRHCRHFPICGTVPYLSPLLSWVVFASSGACTWSPMTAPMPCVCAVYCS